MKKYRKLYLKIDKAPESIKELLSMLYSVDMNNKYIHYKGSAITYSNKGLTTIQCVEKKARSIQDIIRLCQTYFPDVEIKEIFTNLLKFKNGGFHLAPIYCGTIRKANINWSSYTPVMWSFSKYRGIGDYSWKDVLDTLGINTSEKIKSFYLS